MDGVFSKMYALHKDVSQHAVWEAFFMNLLWNVGWQIGKHEYWKHLQHFTLWVDTFNMLTKSQQFQITVRDCGCVCVCVWARRVLRVSMHVRMSSALKMHSAGRSSLRKHSRTSRLHKHACITQIRCCCAYCIASKHALIAFIKTPCLIRMEVH